MSGILGTAADLFKFTLHIYAQVSVARSILEVLNRGGQIQIKTNLCIEYISVHWDIAFCTSCLCTSPRPSPQTCVSI